MRRNQKGSALLWAITVIMILMITVAAALGISYSYYNRSVNNNSKRQAYLTAKGVIQNFVEKLKEQLLEGKAVNIEGLGVFMLAAKSKGSEKQEDITAKSVDSVRIYFQANKELKITKTATRAGEKLDLISLDDYLKGAADGGNGDIVDDPTA